MKDYDTTLARMAGNIAAGAIEQVLNGNFDRDSVTRIAVRVARDLVEEIKRTEPGYADRVERLAQHARQLDEAYADAQKPLKGLEGASK